MSNKKYINSYIFLLIFSYKSFTYKIKKIEILFYLITIRILTFSNSLQVLIKKLFKRFNTK